jgi:hypothetical protein
LRCFTFARESCLTPAAFWLTEGDENELSFAGTDSASRFN